MNRKHKYYIAGLAIVAGAFIIDRFFVSEPQPASGETTTPTKEKKKNTHRKSTGDKNTSTEALDPSITYLDKLAEISFARDVFAPSSNMSSYMKNLQSIATEKESPEQGPKPGSPEAFEAEHELQATFISKGAMMAIVNGKILRLGEGIDGFRVTRITPYMVEFHRGRKHVTLCLPMPIQLE